MLIYSFYSNVMTKHFLDISAEQSRRSKVIYDVINSEGNHEFILETEIINNFVKICAEGYLTFPAFTTQNYGIETRKVLRISHPLVLCPKNRKVYCKLHM